MKNNVCTGKVQELRIIAGQLKGAKILSPKSPGTHPMGSREKLALFNMINPAGLIVLDAFAGSGALGFEALSRGADKVVFVENSAQAQQIIQDNLASLAVRDQQIIQDNLASLAIRDQQILAKAKIFQQKVSRFAKNPDLYHSFDLIIADPPYDKINLSEIQQLVSLLSDGGKLVLSSPASQPAPELMGVQSISSRTYARARLTVYTV